MNRVTLITGGARSGKSLQAISQARSIAGSRKFFIATGEPTDSEMVARIAHHKATRPAEFATLEIPREIYGALESLRGKADVVILDCLTLWVSNLMYAGEDNDSILTHADRLTKVATGAPFATVFVTDEVGSGIVPDNPVARRFRDLLGWTNQKVAACAADVILMVSGCKLQVK